MAAASLTNKEVAKILEAEAQDWGRSLPWCHLRLQVEYRDRQIFRWGFNNPKTSLSVRFHIYFIRDSTRTYRLVNFDRWIIVHSPWGRLQQKQSDSFQEVDCLRIFCPAYHLLTPYSFPLSRAHRDSCLNCCNCFFIFSQFKIRHSKWWRSRRSVESYNL